MSILPEKWKASQAKSDFTLEFPGRMKSWEECRGKTIEHLVPLSQKAGAVLVMTDHTFLIVSPLDSDAGTVREGLRAARFLLEAYYKGAYTELDRLMEADRELTRLSRLENILGAVRTNAPQIPELKKELQRLLDTLPD